MGTRTPERRQRKLYHQFLFGLIAYLTAKMNYILVAATLLTLGLAVEAACPSGETEFSIDGCNTCTCVDNRPVCTYMLCPAGGCTRDYWEDPCNKCICNGGQGSCSLMGCFLTWNS